MHANESATWQSRTRRQHGFTLIEIMVALMLGLLVVTAVIQVFLGTQQSARIQQEASRMQEDGRIAMELLNRYLRIAGYTTNPWDKGETTFNPATNDRGFPPSAPFGAGEVVRGGENDVNGVDSIRIRYQGSGGNVAENPPVAPGDGSITTCLGRAVAINELADITFSLSAPDAAGERSLQCADNVTNATQPLIAGLQNMQIWYGLSQGPGVDEVGRLTGGTTAYVPANLVPATQWGRVIAVRISLLVRSEQDNLTQQAQTITFNGANITPTDRRMRYVMGTTANTRNQAP